MRFLIVVATKFEIDLFLKHIDFQYDVENKVYFFENKKTRIEVLIAGIGIAFTVFNLSKLIFLSKQKYDWVLNVGIAGSFNRQLPLAMVVNVVEDQFADLAIEQANGKLQTIFETNFVNSNEFPFEDGKLKNDSLFAILNFELTDVEAITVNTAHGFEQSIQTFSKKFSADIESMEGAAVFYVCKKEKIKVMQVRSVSNYVEIRNISNWKIKEAVYNLNKFLIDLRLLES